MAGLHRYPGPGLRELEDGFAKSLAFSQIAPRLPNAQRVETLGQGSPPGPSMLRQAHQRHLRIVPSGLLALNSLRSTPVEGPDTCPTLAHRHRVRPPRFPRQQLGNLNEYGNDDMWGLRGSVSGGPERGGYRCPPIWPPGPPAPWPECIQSRIGVDGRDTFIPSSTCHYPGLQRDQAAAVPGGVSVVVSSRHSVPAAVVQLMPLEAAASGGRARGCQLLLRSGRREPDGFVGVSAPNAGRGFLRDRRHSPRTGEFKSRALQEHQHEGVDRRGLPPRIHLSSATTAAPVRLQLRRHDDRPPTRSAIFHRSTSSAKTPFFALGGPEESGRFVGDRDDEYAVSKMGRSGELPPAQATDQEHKRFTRFPSSRERSMLTSSGMRNGVRALGQMSLK